MDADVQHRDVLSSSHSESRDEEYDDCQRGINKLRSSITDIYKANRTWLWKAVLLLVLLLYFAYFAYAMYDSFGDEGSVRLLAATILLVVVMMFKLVWTKVKPSFFKCQQTIIKSDVARKRRAIRWLLYIVSLIIIIAILVVDVAIPTPENLTSLAGLAAFLFISFLCSTEPGKVNWHPVFWGLALQFFFAALILRTQWGYEAFRWLGDRVVEFLAHTDAGSVFVFDKIHDHNFAFALLPTVIFFSACVSILYHLGIMQATVRGIGSFLALCLGTTAPESINAAANIFLGMNMAPMTIAPFLKSMTMSELNAVMTAGFATVTGAVFGAYVGTGVPPNHLMSASVMSAPAALAISKLLYPETETTTASSEDYYKLKKSTARNLVEAASEGATAAIGIIANIIVNIIAFLALLSFVNATLVWFGERAGVENFTFEFICSYLLYPIALFMGTPFSDCRRVAGVVGVKLFTNGFISYSYLQVLRENRQIFNNYTQIYNNTEWFWEGDDAVLTGWNVTLKGGFMEERSEIITTYALCGFSNFGALAVNLACLAALVPSRKSDLSQVAFRAMIGGNMACFFTACIAGLFFKDYETVN